MSAKRSSGKTASKANAVRTWIELDSKACEHNYRTFRGLIDPGTKMWAVVKSNAYGHGLFHFAKLLQKFGVDGFCVDSVLEGFALRREGIRKPILVLGPTLPSLFKKAADQKIIISISNFEGLDALSRTRSAPFFHLKIDTGMHRQGFFEDDALRVIKKIKGSSVLKNKFAGLYTHFAMATDKDNRGYSEKQFEALKRVIELFEKAGFEKLIKHCAATGGTLLDKKFHLDMVRLGKGLYGFFPSPELERQSGRTNLKPVLSWRTIISEIKDLKPGDWIGYDLTEKMTNHTKIAVLPIGYWHGLPRSLSSVGEVLIGDKKARILGRISMDLAVVDVTGIKCKCGDEVILIGKNKKDEINAKDVAKKAGTITYELLTRLNPLIEKRIV